MDIWIIEGTAVSSNSTIVGEMISGRYKQITIKYLPLSDNLKELAKKINTAKPSMVIVGLKDLQELIVLLEINTIIFSGYGVAQVCKEIHRLNCPYVIAIVQKPEIEVLLFEIGKLLSKKIKAITSLKEG